MAELDDELFSQSVRCGSLMSPSSPALRIPSLLMEGEDKGSGFEV